MATAELQAVASAVLRLAQQQGHVVPRDIRAELSRAGLGEARWKEVVELLRESLHYRQGRYHVIPSAGSPRLEEEQQHLRQVHDVLQQILATHQSLGDRSDRRVEARVPYTRPVTVQTEDQQELVVFSQDLSPSGIRFIASRSLLGRKLRILLPRASDTEPAVTLIVRILWTTAVAEGLYENGGSFLEMVNEAGHQSAPTPPESP